MACLQCGNCNGTDLLYYCTDRNDFVIREQSNAPVSQPKENQRWKKGDPDYETHRRKIHKDKMIG